MLQVKITFRLDFLTYGKLILNFFCILALIIHELGHGDKENWGSTFGFAWENNRHFATPPTVSRRNDVWEASAETPYWWCIITQIWVVLLTGWNKFPTWHNLSEALPRNGWWHVISIEFLHSFSRRHFAGKPLVTSRNVGCFLGVHCTFG